MGVERGEGREVDRDGNPGKKQIGGDDQLHNAYIYKIMQRSMLIHCTCTPSESVSATATHSVGSNARDQECCDETEHLKSVSIIEHLKLSTRYHTSQCTLQQKLHYYIMRMSQHLIEGIDSRLGQK